MQSSKEYLIWPSRTRYSILYSVASDRVWEVKERQFHGLPRTRNRFHHSACKWRLITNSCIAISAKKIHLYDVTHFPLPEGQAHFSQFFLLPLRICMHISSCKFYFSRFSPYLSNFLLLACETRVLRGIESSLSQIPCWHKPRASGFAAKNSSSHWEAWKINIRPTLAEHPAPMWNATNTAPASVFIKLGDSPQESDAMWSLFISTRVFN